MFSKGDEVYFFYEQAVRSAVHEWLSVFVYVPGMVHRERFIEVVLLPQLRKGVVSGCFLDDGYMVDLAGEKVLASRNLYASKAEAVDAMIAQSGFDTRIFV